MDSSYPYRNVALKLGVPYAIVLRYSDLLEGRLINGTINGEESFKDEPRGWASEVHLTYLRELHRRHAANDPRDPRRPYLKEMLAAEKADPHLITKIGEAAQERRIEDEPVDIEQYGSAKYRAGL